MNYASDWVRFTLMFKLSFVLIAFIVTLAAITESAEHESGIEGTFTIGPLHGGPIRQGESGSGPLTNASFSVTNDKGERLLSFRTDDNGHFAVALQPGHYTVTHNGERIGMHGFGPFEVNVEREKMTKVDWHADTGMR